MASKFLKLFVLPLFAIVAVFVACNKTTDVTADEYIDQALYSVQERGGLGRYGCYELQFPVTIELPDASQVEVNSYEEMKDAMRTWFESNGGSGQGGHHGANRPHPKFVFPITVLSQDGELITVDDETEFRQLRADCPGTFGQHGHQGHGQHGLACFEIVFPITINFPDGTTASVTDRQNMRQTIRQWRANNPDATERPEIAFPITVKMTDDGSEVVVNSRQELHDLKESCE